MGRRKKNDADMFFGTLKLIFILIIISAVMKYAYIAIPLLVLGVGVYVYTQLPQNCDVCGTQLKRNTYQWSINNQEKKLCPNCNRQLERKQSQQAIKEYL